VAIVIEEVVVVVVVVVVIEVVVQQNLVVNVIGVVVVVLQAIAAVAVEDDDLDLDPGQNLETEKDAVRYTRFFKKVKCKYYNVSIIYFFILFNSLHV